MPHETMPIAFSKTSANALKKFLKEHGQKKILQEAEGYTTLEAILDDPTVTPGLKALALTTWTKSKPIAEKERLLPLLESLLVIEPKIFPQIILALSLYFAPEILANRLEGFAKGIGNDLSGNEAIRSVITQAIAGLRLQSTASQRAMSLDVKKRPKSKSLQKSQAVTEKTARKPSPLEIEQVHNLLLSGSPPREKRKGYRSNHTVSSTAVEKIMVILSSFNKHQATTLFELALNNVRHDVRLLVTTKAIAVIGYKLDAIQVSTLVPFLQKLCRSEDGDLRRAAAKVIVAVAPKLKHDIAKQLLEDPLWQNFINFNSKGAMLALIPKLSTPELLELAFKLKNFRQSRKTDKCRSADIAEIELNVMMARQDPNLVAEYFNPTSASESSFNDLRHKVAHSFYWGNISRTVVEKIIAILPRLTSAQRIGMLPAFVSLISNRRASIETTMAAAEIIAAISTHPQGVDVKQALAALNRLVVFLKKFEAPECSRFFNRSPVLQSMSILVSNLPKKQIVWFQESLLKEGIKANSYCDKNKSWIKELCTQIVISSGITFLPKKIQTLPNLSLVIVIRLLKSEILEAEKVSERAESFFRIEAQKYDSVTKCSDDPTKEEREIEKTARDLGAASAPTFFSTLTPRNTDSIIMHGEEETPDELRDRNPDDFSDLINSWPPGTSL